MAMTVNPYLGPEGHSRVGKFRVVTGTLDLDATYPFGGYPIPVAQLGFMRRVTAANVELQPFIVQLNVLGQTLVIYSPAYLHDGAIPDGPLTRVQADGTTQGANTGADILTQLEEIAAGTNLATYLLVPFRFEGY